MPHFTGTITCKRRDLSFTDYPYGDIYIDDLVFAVPKSTYSAVNIGDTIQGEYSNHVSLNGLPFQNLLNFTVIANYKQKFEFALNIVTPKQDWVLNEQLKPLSNGMWFLIGFLSFCFSIGLTFLAYTSSWFGRYNWLNLIQCITGLIILFLIGLHSSVVTHRNKAISQTKFFEYLLKVVEYHYIPQKDVYHLVYQNEHSILNQFEVSREQFSNYKFESHLKVVTLLSNKIIFIQSYSS